MSADASRPRPARPIPARPIPARPIPTVTFSSDFGEGSPYVAAMKGAVLAACPEARLVDVSHAIPAFDLRGGAFVAWAGSRHFPPGTVHLVVVDPGVGTPRQALAMEVRGSFYVGPDNGVFDLVLEGGDPDLVVALARPEGASMTFEGRDVFAPAAAALAAGAPVAELGARTSPRVHLPEVGPCVVWVDSFGNLVTSLSAAPAGIRIGGREVREVGRTFGEVARGEPVCYLGSMGRVEVGVREGRADAVLGVGPGESVEAL